MKTEEIIHGEALKTFIRIYTEDGEYSVAQCSCTDADIKLGCLADWGIDYREEYPYLNANGLHYNYTPARLDVGDIVEIDNETKFMRIG